MMFGVLGALFVLTQFLQFQLGYTPLQAGVRMLPAAGAIVLVAPLSSELVRGLGTKLTIIAGLLIATAGLWQISGATVTTSYGGIVAGMALLGVGAGLVIPPSTGFGDGLTPREHTGVGGATNGTFLQVGGALGVAVIGSLLSSRYQDRLTSALAPYHLPARPRASRPRHARRGARRRPPRRRHHRHPIARAAHAAFISGMDLGLFTAAVVALAAAVIAFATLPGGDPPADASTTHPRPPPRRDPDIDR